MIVKSKEIPSLDPCDSLKEVLLNVSPAKFERLARCLFCSLLGVPFRNARSGDQRGVMVV